jgi:hypothetical protein
VTIRTLTTLAGLLLASTAIAEGVSVNPGKWEMTMTMEMETDLDLPVQMPPQTHTSTECIEQEELGPDDFEMEEDSPCEFGEVSIDGNTVSWSVTCPGPAGSMTGNWSFTSHGDTITGQGSMSGDMGGQSMDFSMTWGGRRIGDCD